jgi:tRNA threonylcarbamoyladenosine biosynthesis protein TsaE
MSTVTTWETFSRKPEDTEALAANLAPFLRGGETIELKSDLGGGKTTFVRGLVQALGSTDTVASPTFMISKEYASPNFRIVHFDFYRLQEAGDIREALLEAALDDKTVCIIEWGDILDDVLPKNRTIIEIERVPTGEDERLITIATPQAYLLEGVRHD